MTQARGLSQGAHRYSLNSRCWNSGADVRPQGALSTIVVSPKSSPAWITVLPL